MLCLNIVTTIYNFTITISSIKLAQNCTLADCLNDLVFFLFGSQV